jgi:hypothetical protein
MTYKKKRIEIALPLEAINKGEGEVHPPWAIRAPCISGGPGGLWQRREP